MRTSILALSIAALIASGSAAVAQSANSNTTTGAAASTTVAADAKTNYGTVISGLQAGKGADLSTFNKDTSKIECVKVSSLSGGGDAAALDNALTKNESSVTTLRSDVTANADLLAKIKTTCSVADASDIIHVMSGTDGMFTVYVDDRS